MLFSKFRKILFSKVEGDYETFRWSNSNRVTPKYWISEQSRNQANKTAQIVSFQKFKNPPRSFSSFFICVVDDASKMENSWESLYALSTLCIQWHGYRCHETESLSFFSSSMHYRIRKLLLKLNNKKFENMPGNVSLNIRWWGGYSHYT